MSFHEVPEDWTDAPGAKEWLKQAAEHLPPLMEDVAFTVTLTPAGRKLDMKWCVELGASIMLNKPIMAIVMGTEKDVPDKLRLVSDEIVVVPEGVSPSSTKEVQEAMVRMVNRFCPPDVTPTDPPSREEPPDAS